MCKLLSTALAVLTLGSTVLATSYLPVTFQQLVSKADVIFVGEVIDVRPFSVSARDGRIIKTRVVFRVSESLGGDAGSTQILEFLGGELNGDALRVAGMPEWRVGDRHVIFAYRGPSVNPIVGFTQGALRLKRDASGAERVLTNEGVALDRLASIGSSARRSATPAGAVTLSELRDQVRAAIATGKRR